MKRFFLLMISLITVILLVVSCEKGEKTVRVPLFLVNKAVAKEFPVDKNLVLARALLENPKVSFSDERLIMDLDYKISLAGNKSEGKTKVSSAVSYDSATREVYLTNLSVDEIRNKDGSLVEKGRIYDVINELLANYLAKKPVYEMEEKYKDYEILGIKIEKGSLAERAYNNNEILERHRHRYEFNNKYKETLVKNGLKISGVYKEADLVEIVELKDHPWFLGCQFHPEFKSKPFKINNIIVPIMKMKILLMKVVNKVIGKRILFV